MPRSARRTARSTSPTTSGSPVTGSTQKTTSSSSVSSARRCIRSRTSFKRCEKRDRPPSSSSRWDRSSSVTWYSASKVTEASAERTAAPHPTAVVFDLDGTLVDSRADIVGAVAFALAEHRAVPRSPEEIASYVGDGARLLVARALGKPVDDARVDAVLATFLARYEAHPADSTVP